MVDDKGNNKNDPNTSQSSRDFADLYLGQVDITHSLLDSILEQNKNSNAILDRISKSSQISESLNKSLEKISSTITSLQEKVISHAKSKVVIKKQEVPSTMSDMNPSMVKQVPAPVPPAPTLTTPSWISTLTTSITEAFKGAAATIVQGFATYRIGTYAVGKTAATVASKIQSTASTAATKLTGAQGSFRDIQLTVANEIRKDFIEGIEGTSETLKDSIAEDTTYLGKALTAVKNITKDAYRDFANMNSESYRIFESYTNFQKAANENIQALGVFQDHLGLSISTSKEVITLFEKNKRLLALDKTDIEAIARDSVARGKIMFEAFDNIRIATEEASKKYGLNVKLIRKDTNVLRKDFQKFGHLSEVALADVVSRMRILGIEAKDLGKMMSFNTFDEAAKSASSLNQAFGMNIDAMKLIKAENPAEIIEMFRDALLNTGRTYDDLTFREKAYLSQHTKMSDDMLKSAMQYGTSSDQFKQSQKDFQEGSMSQTDLIKNQIKALKDLSHSIKTTRKVQTFTSEYDAAKKGYEEFAKRDKKLRDALINSSAALEKFYKQFTGSGSKQFNKSLHDAAKSLATYVKELNNVKINKDLMQSIQNATKGMSNFFKLFNKRLTPAEITAAKKNLNKNIHDILSDSYGNAMNYYKRNKGFYLRFTTRLAGIAAQSLGPIIEKVTEDIHKEMDKLLDSRGNFRVNLVLSRLGISWNEVVKLNDHLTTAVGHLGNISKTIGKGLWSLFTSMFKYMTGTSLPSPISYKGKSINQKSGVVFISKKSDIDTQNKIKSIEFNQKNHLFAIDLFKKKFDKISKMSESDEKLNKQIIFMERFTEYLNQARKDSIKVTPKKEKSNIKVQKTSYKVVKTSDDIKEKTELKENLDKNVIIQLYHTSVLDTGEILTKDVVEKNIGNIIDVFNLSSELSRYQNVDSNITASRTPLTLQT